MVSLAASAGCSSGGSGGDGDGDGDSDSDSDGDVGACTDDDQCNDGVPCTADLCESGECEHRPCQDCCPNPDHVCDAEWGCLEPPRPCSEDADCDDDVQCTIDICRDDLCENRPGDDLCAEGETCVPGSGCCPSHEGSCVEDSDCHGDRFCCGLWTCEGEFGCRFFGMPSCSDDILCTADHCDRDLDLCLNEPDDGLCQDDSFCNGEERCDLEEGCQPAAAPLDCDEPDPCTDDYCDDELGECVHERLCDGPDSCEEIMDIEMSGTLRGTSGCCADDLPGPVGFGPDVIYRLELTEAAVVYIDSIGTEWNTMLSLRSGGDCPGETVIASNDDACGGTASRLITEEPLEAGVYYLVIEGVTEADHGDFVLHIQFDPCPGEALPVFVPAGEWVHRREFCEGGTGSHRGTCDTSPCSDPEGCAPEDLFYFPVCAGEPVTIVSESLTETDVIIYTREFSCAGTELGCVNDVRAGEAQTEILEFTPDESSLIWVVRDGFAWSCHEGVTTTFTR